MKPCEYFRGLVLLCKSELDEKTNGNDGLEAMSAKYIADQEIFEETSGRDIFETSNSMNKEPQCMQLTVDQSILARSFQEIQSCPNGASIKPMSFFSLLFSSFSFLLLDIVRQ